jgi:hypothetical protein
MNPQPNPQETFELRLRTMRTLWFAMILSLGGYFAFTLFMGRSANLQPNPTLSLTFVVMAVAAALISFPLKSRLLNRAFEQQRVPLVQQAYIIALAVTEVGGLLGVLDFFATGNRYYYLPFIIAVCADLLHFPQREHVLKASGKTPIY